MQNTNKLLRAKILKHLKAHKKGDLKEMEIIELEILQEPKLLWDFIDIFEQHFGGSEPFKSADEVETSINLFEIGLMELGSWLQEGYAFAQPISVKMQRKIAKQLVTPEIFNEVRGFLVLLLNSSRIPLTDELKEVMRDFYTNFHMDDTEVSDDNFIEDFFMEFNSSVGGTSEFLFADILMKQMHQYIHPDDQMSIIYDVLNSDMEIIRDSGVLMLLHPDVIIRVGVAQALLDYGDNKHISSKSLRRMILIRNLLESKEKAILDKAIKKARKNTVTIENITAPLEVDIYASPFDGYGVMLFYIGVKNAEDYTYVKLIISDRVGILGAQIVKNQTQADFKQYLKEAKANSSHEKVHHDYLRLVVEYFLAKPKKNSEDVTELSVVEALEIIGLGNVFPQPRLVGPLYESYLKKPLSKKMLEQLFLDIEEDFDNWYSSLPFVNLWIETGPEILGIFEAHKIIGSRITSKKLTKLLPVVVQEIIVPKLEIWTNRLYWLALREKFGTKKSKENNEKYFYGLAKMCELLDEPMNNPLVLAIAVRTIHERLTWISDED